MNRNVIYILGTGVISAAISGLASWYFTKKYYSDKAEKEISEMREYYRKLRSEIRIEKDREHIKDVARDPDLYKNSNTDENKASEKKDKPKSGFDQDAFTLAKTGNEYYQKLVNKYSGIKEKPDLETLAKERLAMDELSYTATGVALAERESPPEDEPIEDDVVGEEIDEISEYLESQGITEPDPEEVRMMRNPNPHPYIISEDEFIEGRASLVQATITFYPIDDTLADEDEDIMQQDIVGQEALDILREDRDDVVYVRNEKLGMEYEIVCSPSSYVTDVLGIHTPPAPVKKPQKKSFDEDEEE